MAYPSGIVLVDIVKTKINTLVAPVRFRDGPGNDPVLPTELR